jgi:hypothetical protein
MQHAEADRSISSDEDSGNASRISAGQSLEICIDVRHELTDDEVFPVSSSWRVDVPRTSERGIHVNRNEDKFPDHTRSNGSIEEALGVSVIKIKNDSYPRKG